ncbi:diguanylate cyclase (GGDEF)-like protein/PAS domain S-box-containing protein [Phyllobacterium ifriqiyense]|uniref:diguanylate cyclase n=1 Tax=Phyllobacterium ifriqiyense TaxID=314238 RepID=A0ABU0S6W5_9HYPH|nr:diguanylate cyclase [Phyllobacterium ifriqiyense]MDQ0996487.1 diguanylate cyclase (GGDEF)-like protein/PAS domain S-box-containing protein [Phyllobacterium ifriqiyense]
MSISKSRQSPFNIANESGGDRLLQIEAVYDRVPVGLCYLNQDGLIVTINDQLSRLLGVESKIAVGRNIEDIVPLHAPLLRKGLAAAKSGEVIADGEVEIAEESFMVSAAAVMNDLGQFAGISVAYTNITELRRATRKLQETEQRTAYALENAGQWIWDLNIPANQVWRSPQYRILLGLDPNAAEKPSVGWDILHPDDRAHTLQAFDDALSGKNPLFEAIYRVKRPDGGDTWILSRGKIVEYDANGAPLRLLATSVDISMQKRIEEQLSSTVELRLKLEEKLLAANRKLRNLSERDHLTNLPNRRKFAHLLRQAFGQAHDVHKDLAVIMVDIDHFKTYNDFYGHLAGDDCLIHVARSLNKVVKQTSGSLARFGGEEFAALLSGVSKHEVMKTATQMLNSVTAMKIKHEASPSGLVSISLGIAILDENNRAAIAGPDDLLNLADTALYQSKRNGRGRVSLWGAFS